MHIDANGIVVNVKQLKRFARGRARQGSEVKKCRKSLPEFFRCDVHVAAVLTGHAERQSPTCSLRAHLPHPVVRPLLSDCLMQPNRDLCNSITLNMQPDCNKLKKVLMQHFARASSHKRETACSSSF